MNTQISSHPLDILLVEDSPSDVILTNHALSKGHLSYRLHVVKDGVEAITFLRRQAPYFDAPRPKLILLDLNLPKKDGSEVLAEIKADEDLRLIPVLVLTTSSAEEDVIKSYKLHANAFISKPVGFDAFVKAVAAIEDFWFTVVTLPPH